MGREVMAIGYWGDIVDSPFHCFGTWSEDASLFEKCNKEFKNTSASVASYNVKVQSRLDGRFRDLFSSSDLWRT